MGESIAGIVPIVAATFTENGVLDEDSFQSLVRHLSSTGAGGLTLFGLATEFYKLTDSERARMQGIFLDETSRSVHVSVIISITNTCYKDTTLRTQPHSPFIHTAHILS